jgi:hypothetical protein
MKILHDKNVCAILITAFIIRAMLIFFNVYQHSPFFYQDLKSVEHNINSGSAPYLNDFGYEVSNIAYSLVCKTEGYANPFGGSTGPTGWSAPGMVLIYAVSFYLFGCFTFGAIMFLYILSLLLSLGIICCTYIVSLHIFNCKNTAHLSSLFIAFCPHDIALFYQHRHMDFNVYAFLFIGLFLLFILFCKALSKKHLILFSCSTGIAILFNPIFILPVLICFLFLIMNQRFNKDILKHIITSVAIISLVIAPYIIYQKSRLGIWSFIKSNSPFELYIGNAPDAEGVLTLAVFYKYHPSRNISEFLSYKTTGEVFYINSKLNVFLNNFNLVKFIQLSSKRFFNFFFLYESVRDDIRGFWLLMKHISYALPGATLAIYLIHRLKDKNTFDVLFYLYISSYALPFLCAGIMPRYSYPIVPLTSILLARIIYFRIQKNNL